MKREIQKNGTSKLQAFGMFLNRHAGIIALSMVMLVMVSTTVFATTTPDADTMWTSLTGELTKWIGRLGGAIIFVGGVMFGHGWLNHDPAQKTTGLNVIIGGAIVLAVVGLASTFLA